jgi:hypothetical protein
MVEIKPFGLSALKAFANIIADEFTSSEMKLIFLEELIFQR